MEDVEKKRFMAAARRGLMEGSCSIVRMVNGA